MSRRKIFENLLDPDPEVFESRIRIRIRSKIVRIRNTVSHPRVVSGAVYNYSIQYLRCNTFWACTGFESRL
jgi:hypothetical protein